MAVYELDCKNIYTREKKKMEFSIPPGAAAACSACMQLGKKPA
jgi:hypothetical protein